MQKTKGRPRGGEAVVFDNKGQPIMLAAVESQEAPGCYLHVRSHAKWLKEYGMDRQFQERFEQRLQCMESSIHKKSGTKKYDKVCERIGRTNKGKIPFHTEILRCAVGKG